MKKKLKKPRARVYRGKFISTQAYLSACVLKQIVDLRGEIGERLRTMEDDIGWIQFYIGQLTERRNV
jgi:hypothetical protein